VKKFGNIFIRFNRIHKCSRQTDRQSDGQTPYDTHGPHLCIALHGRKCIKRNHKPLAATEYKPLEINCQHT